MRSRQKIDIGERSATRSGRFTTYASWKPGGPQNYEGCPERKDTSRVGR